MLGITTFVSGGLITSLMHDLKELTIKTDRLDEKLIQWDREVENAIIQLNEKEVLISTNLDRRAEKTIRRLLDDINKEIETREQSISFTLEEKKKELSKIGVSEIVKQINSGHTEMVVRSLTLKNSKGNIAALIGTDVGGDAYFRLNSDKGGLRYRIRLNNDKPLSEYFNNTGANVLTLGVFGDDNKGFARIYDPENRKTQIEIKGNSKGGVLNSYSSNGKNIVYLGPDSNTGNGLVNVMGLHGESTSSHAPK